MEIKRLITEPILLVKMGMMTKKYRFRFKTYRGGKNQTELLAMGMRARGVSRMTSTSQRGGVTTVMSHTSNTGTQGHAIIRAA